MLRPALLDPSRLGSAWLGWGAARLSLPTPGAAIGAGIAVVHQEFMLVPLGFDSFSEALRAGVEIYHSLKGILRSRSLTTAVGDEGGGTLARTTTTVGNTDGIQCGFQRLRVMGVPWRQDERQRVSIPLGDEMNLRRHAAATASQRFTWDGSEPPFSS